MAKYRPIYIQIWKDPDFQELEPIDKLIFIYLCTNSSTSESGIYPITAKTIADETSIDLQTVRQRLNNGLFKNIFYDETNKVVFVKNFRKYNQGGKPELIRKSIVQDCFCTPNSPLWSKFVGEYPDYCQDIETVVKAFDNSLQTVKQGINTLNNNLNLNNKIKKGELPKITKWADETRLIFAGLKERRGYNSRNPKAEAKAIHDMLDEGVKTDGILRAYDIMKQRSFFTDKNLTMMMVKKDVHEVLKTQHVAPTPKAKSGRVVIKPKAKNPTLKSRKVEM